MQALEVTERQQVEVIEMQKLELNKLKQTIMKRETEMREVVKTLKQFAEDKK